MSTDPKRVELTEGLCRVMHDAYEAAATKAGRETQERSCKPWEDVPEANKVTMRAAVSAALDALTFMGWVSPEEATAREAAARREALEEASRRIIADRDAEVVRLDGIDKVHASTSLNNWIYGMAVGAAHADDVLNDRPARQDHRPHPAGQEAIR